MKFYYYFFKKIFIFTKYKFSYLKLLLISNKYKLQEFNFLQIIKEISQLNFSHVIVNKNTLLQTDLPMPIVCFSIRLNSFVIISKIDAHNVEYYNPNTNKNENGKAGNFLDSILESCDRAP